MKERYINVARVYVLASMMLFATYAPGLSSFSPETGVLMCTSQGLVFVASAAQGQSEPEQRSVHLPHCLLCSFSEDNPNVVISQTSRFHTAGDIAGPLSTKFTDMAWRLDIGMIADARAPPKI